MMLRIPAGLKDHLVELARANGRSINAQVIALIEAAIEEDEAALVLADKVEYLEGQVTEMREQIEELQRSVGQLYRASR